MSALSTAADLMVLATICAVRKVGVQALSELVGLPLVS